jgi:hypothetical protein
LIEQQDHEQSEVPVVTLTNIFSYLIIWEIIGAIIFSLIVLFVFRSGLVYTSRRADGTLKEDMPMRGYLTMGLFLLSIVGFMVLANYYGIARNEYKLTFGALLLINFVLYILLFTFDTLVIDSYVLGYWRPAFLHLPEAMARESMNEHIRKSIPIGIASGVIISLVSTTISYLFLTS